MIEEGQDQRDFHLRRQLAKPLGGKCHEQLETVGIRDQLI
jgi:hypothetical protein